MAVSNGHCDNLDISEIRKFEAALHQHLLSSHSETMKKLRDSGSFDGGVDKALNEAISAYVKQYQAGIGSLSAGSSAKSQAGSAGTQTGASA